MTVFIICMCLFGGLMYIRKPLFGHRLLISISMLAFGVCLILINIVLMVAHSEQSESYTLVKYDRKVEVITIFAEGEIENYQVERFEKVDDYYLVVTKDGSYWLPAERYDFNFPSDSEVMEMLVFCEKRPEENNCLVMYLVEE